MVSRCTPRDRGRRAACMYMQDTWCIGAQAGTPLASVPLAIFDGNEPRPTTTHHRRDLSDAASCHEYVRPASLEEALARSGHAGARVLAGGQTLINVLKHRAAPSSCWSTSAAWTSFGS